MMNTKMIPMLAAVAAAGVILTSLAILSENNIIGPQDPEIVERFTWECSGPICIRPTEVRLGENLYITANDIPKDLTLRLAITNPNGKVWDYIWADGETKPTWNLYIKPDYLAAKNFCTLDDLVGLWTIELQGTNEMSLQFQHGPKILEGSEKHYVEEKNVCP